jgi:serine/threonine protein kinase
MPPAILNSVNQPARRSKFSDFEVSVSASGSDRGWPAVRLPTCRPNRRGEAMADHRSDVFSFGCVLYEMLTGMQPFQGGEISDILASVLKSEPDMTALPAGSDAMSFGPRASAQRHQGLGRYQSRLRSRLRKRKIRYAARTLNGSSPIV